MPFVTFYVGVEETKFLVHEDTLFEASPVFHAAFNPRFQEGAERVMRLPEEHPEIFNVFVDSLYTQTVNSDLLPSENLGWVNGTSYMQIAHLYFLADKYDVVFLQRKILEAFFAQVRSQRELFPDKETIAYIYANTNRRAPIRKLICDWFAWASKGYWQSNETNYRGLEWMYEIPDFGVELAQAFGSRDWGLSMGNPFEEWDVKRYMRKIYGEY